MAELSPMMQQYLEIKKQHKSGHRRMQYSGIPCSHTDRRDRELQTYDGLRCGVCAAD